MQGKTLCFLCPGDHWKPSNCSSSTLLKAFVKRSLPTFTVALPFHRQKCLEVELGMLLSANVQSYYTLTYQKIQNKAQYRPFEGSVSLLHTSIKFRATHICSCWHWWYVETHHNIIEWQIQFILNCIILIWRISEEMRLKKLILDWRDIPLDFDYRQSLTHRHSPNTEFTLRVTEGCRSFGCTYSQSTRMQAPNQRPQNRGSRYARIRPHKSQII